MTVAENIGYGLKIAGLAQAERARRVGDALALVGLRTWATATPACSPADSASASRSPAAS